MTSEPVPTREEREERDQHLKDGLTNDRLLQLASDVMCPSFMPGPLDGVELRFALIELHNRRTGRIR